MRFDQAAVRVTERTYAATGRRRADGEIAGLISHSAKPREMAQRLLSGLLDVADHQPVYAHLRVQSEASVEALMLAEEVADGLGSLYVMFAQTLALGILLGMSDRPRGGGASQEPSGDFDGATE